MNQLPSIDETKSGLLFYLICLTFVFLLLEISFFIQQSGFYLGDFKTVADHLEIPIAVIPAILFFVFAQLLVHISFPLFVWAVTRLTGIALNLSWKTIQLLGFVLWTIGLVTVLFANQIYFPNSKFADLTRTLVGTHLPDVLFVIGSIVFSMACVVACVGLVYVISKQARMIIICMVCLLTASVLSIVYYSNSHAGVMSVSQSKQPNIILIGIDGVRPDYLGYFDGNKKTPNIDSFLKNSIVFGEALTPLARTFPSWVSLLTGKYPLRSGVRFDLADQKKLDFTDSLPKLMKSKLGYETIFAMDETRFSNIEKNLGFDKIITPPVGFNDFLLGTFNDFPLSNLIINTHLGRWLFPYSYANRPAFITYNPDSFLVLLNSELQKSRDKPLFLAVHFCLPHFPYFWSAYSPLKTTKALAHYNASVERSDKQVGDFLVLLKKNGLLDHAIVVLLSDHGEALELAGDRITEADSFISGAPEKKVAIPHFYPPSFDFETVNQSAGHGTDVLGLSQYHSILAFHFYGMNIKPKFVSGLVSLMDVKPTLLNLLNIKSSPGDGAALTDVITGKKNTVDHYTHFFMESDFSPQAVRSVHPETRNLLFEGIDMFQIDPITTKLTVKTSMGSAIISSKQYADIFNGWILALYPQAGGDHIPILVNLNTGLWTNNLNSQFAQQSPAKIMLLALRSFYKEPLHII